ncbi:hypothetical protein NKH18_39695 [Streptomyces sp. M10(2022)]
MDFGLFYFANNSAGTDGYRLLLEGARFADSRGFTSVWTPGGTSTPSVAPIRIRPSPVRPWQR